MQTSELIKLGESFIDERRLVPAMQVFRQVRAQTKVPWYRLLAAYNTGAVSWNMLGDGVAAREAYLDAVSLEGPEYNEAPMRMMRANALENLMLSAISYDEFYSFAERLRAIAPQAPVLSGLPPTVDQIRQGGGPWTDVLFHLATVNYNRNDPARDRARYGVARSTYHLILANRRSFHLARDDWRVVIYEFAALSQRMVVDCTKVRGEPDPNPPDEYMGILSDAQPYVDEYLLAMFGDQTIRTIRDQIAAMLHPAGRLSARETTATIPPPRSRAADGSGLRCRQCHHVLENPLAPCPTCGTPSLIGFWAALLSIGIGLGGGAFLWQYLAGHSALLRVGGSAVGGFILMMLAGPLIMQLCVRWFLRGRD
jgi:hypothetical protein